MLVTCATYNYVEMLEMLLASHRASNPAVPLKVHAIGWPDDVVNNARLVYPNATFLPHELDAGFSEQDTRGPVPRSASILRMKVGFLYTAHKDCSDPVVWVDADTLLLESIDPLVHRVIENGDFGVTERRRKRPHARFAVAVLCFTQSPAATRLLQLYVELTRESKGLVKRKQTDGVAWYHDQLALWHAYKQLSVGIFKIPKKNRPRLVTLSDAEHSIDGRSNAVFVSQRPKTMELPDMKSCLQARGIEISSIKPKHLVSL